MSITQMSGASSRNRLWVDGLSGRYKFFAVKNNANMYVKVDPIPSWKGFGSKFYLMYENGSWLITNEKHALDGNITDNIFKLGFIRTATRGM